jgi:membrane-bound lytic murein transglycosylase B
MLAGGHVRWRIRRLRLAAVVVAPLLPLTAGAQPSSLPAPEGAETTTALEYVRTETADPRFFPGPPPQSVEPQTTLVGKDDRNRKVQVRSAKGTRVWTASALASHDLPQAALAAYKRAAATLAGTDPSCQLPWTLLAGIGRVESDHGRYGGSVLSTDGVARPAIIGVALNGRGPVAAIRDSDDGKLDGDKVWDRAVGPMQFIPTTWKYAGRDGDGDGKANPHDLDDAALAAGAYLCSGSGSMLVESSAKAAIFRYNPSDYYVALVRAFERGYRTGVFVIPSPEPPADEGSPDGTDRADAKKKRDRQQTTSEPVRDRDEPSPKPTPKPSPKPTPKPSPSPTPKPSPTPEPLELTSVSGAMSSCGVGKWCIGEKVFWFGPSDQLSAQAAHDYDGDENLESNSAELDGLAEAGTSVSLRFESGTSPAEVYVVDGQDYRYGDGTFA